MLQNASRNSVGFQTTSGTSSLNAFAFATFKTAALEVGSSANHEKTVSEILSTTDQQRKEAQGRIEKPREEMLNLTRIKSTTNFWRFIPIRIQGKYNTEIVRFAIPVAVSAGK